MYNRVILKGAGPDGEVWSTGMAFLASSGDPVNTTDALQAWAEGIADLATAWTTGMLRQFMSTSLTLVAVRTELRNEDETIANLQEYMLATPFAGSGTLSKPLQSSCVITLQTATPGGRGRGRVYWPALNYANTATGRFSTSNLLALLTDFAQFANAIEAIPDPDFLPHLAVRSVVDHQCRLITTLRAGNVPDTQRRRRDALIETYQAVAYP